MEGNDTESYVLYALGGKKRNVHAVHTSGLDMVKRIAQEEAQRVSAIVHQAAQLEMRSATIAERKRTGKCLSEESECNRVYGKALVD